MSTNWKAAVAALMMLLAAALLQSVEAAPVPSILQPDELRCEYLSNPRGIDVARPRLSWLLPVGPRGRRQSAYRILVAGTPEQLGKGQGEIWDSGVVKSDQSTFVEYDGRPLTSGMRCYWKVRVWDGHAVPSRWSTAASWSMGLLQESDWDGSWIGAARPADVPEGTPLPFPWLRKRVTLRAKPRRATAYVNALGYYELYVNGRKVDDHVLAPAVSDYSKRNLYVTHDITGYLVKGENCIALWLGRGWYVRGHPGVVHDGPLVRAQFDITLADGAAVKVGTDETWKVRESPIRPLGRGLAFGDYGGELYDARQELPGWDTVQLDDSAWRAATVFTPPPAITSAQMVEPNRIMADFRPVKVEESGPGVYMFDLGRNVTGWFDLRIPPGIPAGTSVKLEYADAPPSGMRFASFNQRDEYITRGVGEEHFRSRFNYHGFRCIRVTGLQQPPSVEDGHAYLIHTAYEPAGAFECSNELLNQIYRMVTWTYRCLSLGGYVVDCPTRERLGYGGDAGTSLETAMFGFGTGALYTSWATDWRDAQDPETGDLPFTAPAYQDRGGGGPMWSGFVVTMPWQLYLQYGDRRILTTCYPMMQKWLAYLQSEAGEKLLESHRSYLMRLPQWTFLGDWLAPRPAGEVRRGRTPADPRAVQLINNCHYVYQLQLAARIARILGRPEDSAGYETRAATMRRLLHERFFDADKQGYATGEQPCLAFPLLLQVPPPELRGAVMRNLQETIHVRDHGHINAGMHGTYFLLKYLLEADRNDLIYEMVNQRDYPGWGYMLAQGATTSWESWSGGSSHIHDTLISIGSWFVQGIGGIRGDESAPGFRHFEVRPAPVGDLIFARNRYQSLHGLIVSDWRITKGVLRLYVTVPVGTTATVYVPTTDATAVTENGRPPASSPGVKPLPAEQGKAVYRLISGRYAFAAPFRR
jgi:alpha-L-rhamnosidase